MRKFIICLTALLFTAALTFAQTTIRGKVSDRNGQPVEGATVKEKGTKNSTTTDKDGNYTIKVGADATLSISGTGLTEQEVSTKGKSYVETTMLASAVNLTNVEVVGTRSLRRSATETPVPIDIIPISKVTNVVGQVDLNQILQYVAPSFNSNRQSGADGADHVDPASLRGLGPDQTLVLLNGKRWHQSSLINLFGTRGRGNTGTDLNAIPAAAIERIEILRDGASAQYGSDAIAGVINIVLKSSVKQGTANVSGGTFITGYGKSLNSDNGKVISNQTDGLTLNGNVNYGFALKKGGFVNLTGDVLRREKTFRPNYKTPDDTDPRVKAGDASLTNYSVYFNAGFPVKGATSFYAFGGMNQRNGSAYAYTRHAADSRNVPAIYPDGFNPVIQSDIQDRGVSFGLKTKFGSWNADFNATMGSNRFEYAVHKSLNTSMGAASQTHFNSGGFKLSQNMIGASFTRAFSKVAKGANVAMGAELRQDQYKIFAGELASYKQYPTPNDAPGGSQGFPGFQPSDECNKQRINIGAYADAELDVTKSWMISGAVRVENYNDFGWTTNGKFASRLKFSDKFAIRGSVSTGFRAPSLPQINFSNTFTNVANYVISEVVIAPNSGALAKLVGIPALKQETSVNGSFGFTTKPVRNLVITADAYWVSIRNRVVQTGYFDQTDDVIGSILAARNIGSAQFFTNSVDTRTHGLDLIATYSHKLWKGKLSATFAGNFNKLEINKVKTTDALKGKEDIYFSPREQYFLMASAPEHKLSLQLEYKINSFTTNLRFTNFAAIDLIDYSNSLEHNSAKTTTDLSFSYQFSSKVNATLGAANLFDVYPDHHSDPGLTETGSRWEAIQMGMGGAFYFAKVGIRF